MKAFQWFSLVAWKDWVVSTVFWFDRDVAFWVQFQDLVLTRGWHQSNELVVEQLCEFGDGEIFDGFVSEKNFEHA